MGRKEGEKEEKKDKKQLYKANLPEQVNKFIKLYTDSLCDHYCYVISYTWWVKWKKYASFNEEQLKWERGRDMGRMHPGEICNTDILDSPEKYYGNVKGPLYLQFPLKPGLVVDKDVKTLKGECARFLYELYGGTQIIRREKRDEKGMPVVELYPPHLNVLVLPDLRNFELPMEVEYKQLLVDPDISIQQIKKDLPHYSLSLTTEQFRLWKLAPMYSFSSFLSELREMEITQAKYNRKLNTFLQEHNCGVEFPGASADFYPEAPIGKFFADSSFLIIETASPAGEYIFKYRRNARPGVCPACNIYRTLAFSCSCGKVTYCSEECKEKDKANHSQVCPNVGIGDIYVAKKANAKNGLVGLTNMGNTCYLNSALQCLSSTYELTKYFLDNAFAGEINTENKLGFGGELAQAYAKFVFSMWNSDEAVVMPHYLKKVLAKYHPIVFILLK